jgi:hypothetical protein
MEQWRPKRKHREPPYYKVQVFNEAFQSWKDERPAFDTIDEAKTYISQKMLAGTRTRLVLIEERGRRPIDS